MHVKPTLAEKAEKIEWKAKDIMESAFKQCSSVEALKSMKPEELALIQNVLELCDMSIEYVKAQAKTIDEINDKLDLLLESK